MRFNGAYGTIAATIAVTATLAIATPARAETPRDLLTVAAFQTQDRKVALSLVTRAIALSEAQLARSPGDREATLQRGIGIGYRATLTKSRSDAKASLAIFQSLAASNPNDAEAQMVLAGWHLDAIDQLGAMMARAVLGAKGAVGEAALERSVALGGKRAFFAGTGALLRIRHERSDVAAVRKWAEAAAVAPTPTPLDQMMKRNAAAILPALRANDGKAAQAIARRMLPFGRFTG